MGQAFRVKVTPANMIEKRLAAGMGRKGGKAPGENSSFSFFFGNPGAGRRKKKKENGGGEFPNTAGPRIRPGQPCRTRGVRFYRPKLQKEKDQ